MGKANARPRLKLQPRLNYGLVQAEAAKLRLRRRLRPRTGLMSRLRRRLLMSESEDNGLVEVWLRLFLGKATVKARLRSRPS